MAGRKRHTEAQIIAILREIELGMTVTDASRKHVVSHGSIHRWKSKYGGMESSRLK